MTRDIEAEGYIQRVRDDTNRYIDDLLGEIERLRLVLAQVEDDKLRLEKRFQDTSFEWQREMDRQQDEKTRLQEQIARINAENSQFVEQCAQVQRQNANLANLYVASYRLHSTLDRDQALSVIQEIIINLIGSEELAIYELDSQSRLLRLIACFGLDPQRYGTMPLQSSLIGRAVQSGNVFLAVKETITGAAGEESNLTACIPLKLDDEVIGAIAIFQLLQHKSGLEDVDFEMFDLLATHAATALYTTSLHARLRSEEVEVA